MEEDLFAILSLLNNGDYSDAKRQLRSMCRMAQRNDPLKMRIKHHGPRRLVGESRSSAYRRMMREHPLFED